MAEVYYYVPQDMLSDVVDCGLKLSEWYDREISLPGFQGNRKVLRTLLNPNDEKKINDPSYQCLRLDVGVDYCVVGDSDLYQMDPMTPDIRECYQSGLTPLEEYIFGTFRNPEVLVMTSVLPEKIKILGKNLDTPILFESSAKLYLKNIMEKHEEIWSDSGNHLLYTFFDFMESREKAKKIVNSENNKVVFFYNNNKEYIVLQIPKEDLYR